MTTAEAIQLALGIIALGGIGGIWFRLGQALTGLDAVKEDVRDLDIRVRHLETANWRETNA